MNENTVLFDTYCDRLLTVHQNQLYTGFMKTDEQKDLLQRVWASEKSGALADISAEMDYEDKKAPWNDYSFLIAQRGLDDAEVSKVAAAHQRNIPEIIGLTDFKFMAPFSRGLKEQAKKQLTEAAPGFGKVSHLVYCIIKGITNGVGQLFEMRTLEKCAQPRNTDEDLSDEEDNFCDLPGYQDVPTRLMKEHSHQPQWMQHYRLRSKITSLVLGPRLAHADPLSLSNINNLVNKYLCKENYFFANVFRLEYIQLAVVKHAFNLREQSLEIMKLCFIDAPHYPATWNGRYMLKDPSFAMVNTTDLDKISSTLDILEELELLKREFEEYSEQMFLYNLAKYDMECRKHKNFLLEQFRSLSEKIAKLQYREILGNPAMVIFIEHYILRRSMKLPSALSPKSKLHLVTFALDELGETGPIKLHRISEGKCMDQDKMGDLLEYDYCLFCESKKKKIVEKIGMDRIHNLYIYCETVMELEHAVREFEKITSATYRRLFEQYIGEAPENDRRRLCKQFDDIAIEFKAGKTDPRYCLVEGDFSQNGYCVMEKILEHKDKRAFIENYVVQRKLKLHMIDQRLENDENYTLSARLTYLLRDYFGAQFGEENERTVSMLELIKRYLTLEANGSDVSSLFNSLSEGQELSLSTPFNPSMGFTMLVRYMQLMNQRFIDEQQFPLFLMAAAKRGSSNRVEAVILATTFVPSYRLPTMKFILAFLAYLAGFSSILGGKDTQYYAEKTYNGFFFHALEKHKYLAIKAVKIMITHWDRVGFVDQRFAPQSSAAVNDSGYLDATFNMSRDLGGARRHWTLEDKHNSIRNPPKEKESNWVEFRNPDRYGCKHGTHFYYDREAHQEPTEPSTSGAAGTSRVTPPGPSAPRFPLESTPQDPQHAGRFTLVPESSKGRPYSGKLQRKMAAKKIRKTSASRGATATAPYRWRRSSSEESGRMQTATDTFLRPQRSGSIEATPMDSYYSTSDSFNL